MIFPNKYFSRSNSFQFNHVVLAHNQKYTKEKIVNLYIFLIVSITQIEAYIGIWIRLSDDTTIVCHSVSSTSLSCLFQGVGINTTYMYNVDGETITRVNDINAITLALTGSYNGKDTITWINGEVWGKAGTVVNYNSVIRYVDTSHICKKYFWQIELIVICFFQILYVLQIMKLWTTIQMTLRRFIVVLLTAKSIII